MNSDAMNAEQPQESFGSGASEAPAARSAELRSLYTPGPWSYEMPDEVVVRAPDGGRLAQLLFLRGRHGTLGRRNTDEVIANARLIASAPDLLDALRDALEFIEDHADVSDGPDGSPRPNRAMQLCEPIRAALAKAGVKP
jgi:hypothetical protein